MRLLPKNERTRMMGLGVVLLTLAQLFGCGIVDFVRAIEAAHGIKENT